LKQPYTIAEKTSSDEKMSKMVMHLWIYASKQVGYMLEKIQIIWNCTLGSNQNVVFEFVGRKVLVLPTLKAFQDLKNWYFTMIILPQHQPYVNNTCTKC